ncbi:MAG: amino acid permease [bacterium]|nr:amino acid permease [bacterium]
MANMIGSGIFTTSGLMAKQLPSPAWVIACWLLGGMVALAGALCYSELATRMPKEGGEYVYLKELFHPGLGFLTGWTSFFVGFSAPIALSALGFGVYLLSGFKNRFPTLGLSESHEKFIAVVVIAIFTWLHYLGGRTGPRIQNVLTALKILLIAGLAAVGLGWGEGTPANLTVAEPAPFSLMAFGTAMMMVMFSYSGWNAGAYIAGEVKNPRKTLPISLISGTLIVIALYIGLNVFYFHAVPYHQVAGEVAVAESALVGAFGKNITELLGAVIAVVLLSSLSAFIMIGPRVYYAMAEDGLFFRFAARIHPKREVPGAAILVQGVVAVAMVIAGTFEQLLVYVGFALGIFPLLAVAGLFKARRLKIGEDSALKLKGVPLIAGFFLAANLSLMIIACVNRPMESAAAVLTVLTGVPFYYIWVKGMHVEPPKSAKKDRKRKR